MRPKCIPDLRTALYLLHVAQASVSVQLARTFHLPWAPCQAPRQPWSTPSVVVKVELWVSHAMMAVSGSHLQPCTLPVPQLWLQNSELKLSGELVRTER